MTLLNEYKTEIDTQQLDKTMTQLADMVTYVDSFAVQIPETDDTARFQRAIGKTLLGDTLYLPSRPINLSNTIIINKPIRLLGSGIVNHTAAD